MSEQHAKRGRHEQPDEVVVIRDPDGEILYEWSFDNSLATRGVWCLRHDSDTMGGSECEAVRLMRSTGRSEFLDCWITQVLIEYRGVREQV